MPKLKNIRATLTYEFAPDMYLASLGEDEEPTQEGFLEFVMDDMADDSLTDISGADFDFTVIEEEN